MNHLGSSIGLLTIILFCGSPVTSSLNLRSPSRRLSPREMLLGQPSPLFGYFRHGSSRYGIHGGRIILLPEGSKARSLSKFLLGKRILPRHPGPSVASPTEGEKQPDLATLTKVIAACRTALLFFRQHVTEMNLDAVIGTRIAEAQFKMVLEALEEQEGRLSKNGRKKIDIAREFIIKDLRSLHQGAVDLNSVAQPFIKSTAPDYYRELCKLLEPGFWEVPLTIKHFSVNLKPLTRSTKVLNGVEQLVESQSDQCVTETGGAGPDDYRGSNISCANEHCSLSQKCWDLMTNTGYSGYSLTHQVFYIVIGLQAGCRFEEEQLAYSTIRNETRMTVAMLLEELCYAILNEASTIASAGFPETRQDLFMEQGALCGLVGYRDFFRKPWLAKVLSWQRSSGCFGDALLYYATHSNKSVEGELFQSQHPRRKREETAMTDRCLAHRTAVALGYLSLYVRYLALSLFT